MCESVSKLVKILNFKNWSFLEKMKIKPNIISLEDAKALVVHSNNKCALLVYIENIKHIRIGTVDTCVLSVSDPWGSGFQIQFQRHGSQFAALLKEGIIILIKVTIW